MRFSFLLRERIVNFVLSKGSVEKWETLPFRWIGKIKVIFGGHQLTNLDNSPTLQEEEMRAAQTKTKGEKVSEDFDGQGYTVQANPTLGGVMFTLRGRTGEDVAELMETVATAADKFFEAYLAVKQVTLAKGLTVAPGQPINNGASTVHAAGASGSTTAELRCQHGPYKDFKGKSKKNGDPYQYRYYCAGPFGSGCNAKDLAGQEAWSA